MQKCNTNLRIMDETLQGVEKASSFIDDVTTYNSSFEKMLSTLKQTLDKLSLAHLQMLTDKCLFGNYEINYVGYHISSAGVTPICSNVEAIFSFSAPTNNKELNRSVGISTNLSIP